MEMRPTVERLEDAERLIRAPSFRQNKGLGNEVGYYVFDYPAIDELEVREWVRYWKDRNNPDTDGYTLAVFDLYDIMIDMLEKEGYLEQCFTFEKQSGIGEIIDAVMDLFQLDQADGYLIDYIKANTPSDSVVLLTGVGKCYPVLRSHHILNNLHQVFDKVPVVLLYPGKYDGQELVLFDSVKDNNYYRAFRLVNN